MLFTIIILLFLCGNLGKGFPEILAQYLYCFAERNEGENNLNCTLRQVTIQFFS